MTKSDVIKKNINYLLKSRNETQVSLSEGAGVNRTTIYNILEGRVVRIQETTLRKVANFFGVSFSEMQTVDLFDKDVSNRTVSPEGNMNPVAVPIVTDNLILSAKNEKVGSLVVSSQITYYFGEGPNIIGVLLTKDIKGCYKKGDLLIVRRDVALNGANLLLVTATGILRVINENKTSTVPQELLGTIIEERYG